MAEIMITETFYNTNKKVYNVGHVLADTHQ